MPTQLDQFDKIARAIVDDCSDELNQTHEPANLKYEIAAALRRSAGVAEAIQAERDRLTEFAVAVANLRAAQKAYFRDRKQSDLVASKQCERDVDDRLARMAQGTEQARGDAQGKLL
jgi:hypothetical protein